MYPSGTTSLFGKLLLFHLIGDTAATANSFWDCLILSDECIFFSGSDPYLIYFGFGIIGLYSLFLTMFLADLKFWWNIDNFHKQIDQLLVKVRCKVKKVMQRRDQPSVVEIANHEMKESQQGQRVAAALRYIVANDLPLQMTPASPQPSLNKWKNSAFHDQPSKSRKQAVNSTESNGTL